jgi:hypothetical protein
MKYLLLTTLFCCLSFTLVAQDETLASDYQLFRPGVQYLYDNPNYDVEYYSRIVGMKLDSSRRDTHGRYTLYHSLSLDAENNCTRLEPSFAGTSLSYTDSTTVLYFSDSLAGSRLIIRQRELPGESWEAAPGIIARVIRLENGEFADITDSVKTIRFTDALTDATLGNDLQVSKRHGLWSGTWFPKLREASLPLLLISSSSPSLGPQLPTVDDIFNIPVGTELSISTREAQIEASPFFWYYETFRRNITVQSVSIDSTAGVLTIRFSYDENYFRQAPEYYGDSIYAASRTNGRSGSWEYELAYLESMQSQPGAATFGGQDSSCLLFATAGYRLFNDCIGLGRGADFISCRRPEESSCFEPLIDVGSSGLYFRYAAGGFGELGTFRPFSRTLARVKNELVDCGLPFDLLVANRSITDDSRIRLFPNPASGRVFLDVPADLGGVSLRIHAADGRLVGQHPSLPGTREISVATLPPGVYSIFLSNGGGPIGQRRLVVVR